jgi:hypothetical protein
VRARCLALFPAALLAAVPAAAATGCDLSSPDSDVPRPFPGSTRYRASYINLREDQLRRVVDRLGERFRALYDPLNVPYTLYEIYNGSRRIGYIHGVNQKGQYGGLQVFVSLDLRGRIKTFYIQKISGQWAGRLRDAAFGRQFNGMALADFESFDPATGKGAGRLAQVKNPAPEMETDFYAVLRALKKNLVLMDVILDSAGGAAL